MKGINLILAALAVIAITTDFRVQAFPRPQEDSSTRTVADGFVFDGVADRQEPSSRPPTSQPPFERTAAPDATIPAETPSSTVDPDVMRCKQNCKFRTTNEYNPVCGTDQTVYDNRAKLNCASNCGFTVEFAYFGPCKSEIRG